MSEKHLTALWVQLGDFSLDERVGSTTLCGHLDFAHTDNDSVLFGSSFHFIAVALVMVPTNRAKTENIIACWGARFLKIKIRRMLLNSFWWFDHTNGASYYLSCQFNFLVMFSGIFNSNSNVILATWWVDIGSTTIILSPASKENIEKKWKAQQCLGEFILSEVVRDTSMVVKYINSGAQSSAIQYYCFVSSVWLV